MIEVFGSKCPERHTLLFLLLRNLKRISVCFRFNVWSMQLISVGALSNSSILRSSSLCVGKRSAAFRSNTVDTPWEFLSFLASLFPAQRRWTFCRVSTDSSGLLLHLGRRTLSTFKSHRLHLDFSFDQSSCLPVGPWVEGPQERVPHDKTRFMR